MPLFFAVFTTDLFLSNLQMPPNMPYFNEDGKFYFLLLPQLQGQHGAYMHIAKIDASESVDVSKNNFTVQIFFIWYCLRF